MVMPYSIIVTDEVITRLSCFYPREKVMEWMGTPVKYFGGNSALEMIRDGKHEAVQALAERMVKGAVAARGSHVGDILDAT